MPCVKLSDENLGQGYENIEVQECERDDGVMLPGSMVEGVLRTRNRIGEDLHGQSKTY
jgi:hypothetical protein